MERKLGDIAFGAVAGLGLGVSGLLLYEYVAATAHVCGPGGGCATVAASSWASIWGVPTPLFGVVFFAVAASLRIGGGPAARRLLPIWLAGGAIAGAGFIAVQAFVVEAYCKLCITADLSAIALIAIWVFASRERREPVGRAMPVAVLVAALAPVAVGVALADRGEPAASGDLPALIAAEQRPGVVTVVEFLDFQCPHCRLLHSELEKAKQEFPGEVRVVRKNVPLPAHEHAAGAALAAICAEAQGHGDQLADAMLTADDIGPESRELLAGKTDLDMQAWRDCLESDFARRALERQVQEAESLGIRALPTYYIGAQRFTGARPAAELREAMAAAAD